LARRRKLLWKVCDRVRQSKAFAPLTAAPDYPPAVTIRQPWYANPMTAHLLRRLPLAAIILGAALSAAIPVESRAQARGTSGLPSVAGKTLLRPGDTTMGALPVTQPMHIVVALKLRNRDQLDGVIAAHRTLASAEIARQHLPTPGQVELVVRYLRTMGYLNVVVSSNRLLVSAEGTAANAQAAFLTSFKKVRTQEGRTAFANTSEAHVPAALQNSVLSVIGLQNVHQPHTFAPRPTPGAITAPLSISGHDPIDFGPIYGATGVKTAAGVAVGIITVGNVDQTVIDLAQFTTAHNLPTVATQIVGSAGNGDWDQGVVEWNLDSQTIVGTSGGRVGKLIFYTGSGFQYSALLASFNDAVTANVAKIINVSIGGCEIYAQGAIADASNQIFALGTAQGQTFAIATGDSGANECYPYPGYGASWPANSPYVVAVAGTLLYASPTTWGREIVWSDSGGSPSKYEPKPVWQNGFVAGTKRGVADVAFDASPTTGAHVVYYGGLYQVGGTSLSAPIFAGLWARLIATKGGAVGFAAPLLYALPASDFRDITYGNNRGYAATPGYDFASGRGSLILNSAINHIAGSTTNVAPVANFSFTTLGLTARFYDGSSDSDGTIIARSWKFGDGTASAATNPSHVYAKAGTYSVSETVTDNGGKSVIKTRSVTVG
jgi:subtilase family serine protease